MGYMYETETLKFEIEDPSKPLICYDTSYRFGNAKPQCQHVCRMQYQKNEKIEYTFNPNGRSRISSDSVDYIGDCECNPEDHPSKITHISMFHDKEMNRFCTRYTPESSIKNDQSTINCKNLHGSYGTKGAEAYCK